MVGHHLPVVLAVGLRIQNEYLVSVKGALGEVVELERACKRYVGVVYPCVDGVEDLSRDVAVYILSDFEVM